MTLAIVGAGVGIASAGYSIYSGVKKNAAANKLASSNIRPMFSVPDEYYKNANLAGQQAETGLSPSTVNYYTTQATRGLGTGVGGILQGGGDADTLSKLYDQFSQGLSQESAQDQQLKDQHLNTFLNANNAIAGQKTQQWALNDYDPYKDNAQLVAQERAAGAQDIGQGITSGMGSIANLSNSMLYNNGTTSGVPTFAQKNGSTPIPDAMSGGITAPANPSPVYNPSTLPQYTIPGATPPAPTAYTTPGGQAVMGVLGKTDANSLQLQQLIQYLNQQQVA